MSKYDEKIDFSEVPTHSWGEPDLLEEENVTDDATKKQKSVSDGKNNLNKTT